jgi:hypothetical protein
MMISSYFRNRNETWRLRKDSIDSENLELGYHRGTWASGLSSDIYRNVGIRLEAAPKEQSNSLRKAFPT